MTTEQRRATSPDTVIPRPTRPVLEILRQTVVLPEGEPFEITIDMFEGLSLGDYEALVRGVDELNPGALEYVARMTRRSRKSPGHLVWL